MTQYHVVARLIRVAADRAAGPPAKQEQCEQELPQPFGDLPAAGIPCRSEVQEHGREGGDQGSG